MLLYFGFFWIAGRCALCLFPELCLVSAEGLGIDMGYAYTPRLPYGSGGGWSRDYASWMCRLGGRGVVGCCPAGASRPLASRCFIWGLVWGALAASVVAAGMRCGRRCRLRHRLVWCTRRAFMACRGFLLVPVHMGVCCAGEMPAGRCWLLCAVFPVLCMSAATYSVHALQFRLVFRLLLC